MTVSRARPFKGSQNAAPLPVLILEDERFDRHRLARMCSGLSFPCEVSNAKTLEDFSTVLEKEIYGLILIDYRLPDGTGFDALDMVRLSARNLNAPTLMISGSRDESIVLQAREAGCAAYLPKDDLTATIFSTAVRDALGPADDPPSLNKTVFDRDEMTSLLALVTQRSARRVKPMVSRMMRQLRGIRANAGSQEDVALQAVEQNCMSLWALLIEMERQDATTMLQELEDNPKFALVARDTAKTRKPPSPFTRLRQ